MSSFYLDFFLIFGQTIYLHNDYEDARLSFFYDILLNTVHASDFSKHLILDDKKTVSVWHAVIIIANRFDLTHLLVNVQWTRN